MFRQTYFEPGGLLNPLPALERLLHPYRHRNTIQIAGRSLSVSWTQRAQRELQRRDEPLTVEMQLYFSCVVKKRVLFERRLEKGVEAADGGLRVAFHAVQASACDPVEFAQNYPEKRRMESPAALRMHPRQLLLDFRNHQWQGEFEL